MRIKFYVINQNDQMYSCFLTSRNEFNNFEIGRKLSKQDRKENFRIIPFCFHLFINEIQCCQFYRLSLVRYIKSLPYYVIKLEPPRHEYIDKVWGEIVRQLVWEQIEIDHMFSWLSTLGGAFSALGDYFEDRAKIAGKISIHQLRLAHRLGDPNLISRCKLFLSISLIQQENFKLAKRIIRDQYEFAQVTDDTRLIKMCLGIWSKLQYSHKIYKNKRKIKK